MPVHVTASGTGRVVVVSLVGDHDLASAGLIRQTLLELSPRVRLVVVDFAATTFIDSSVLGVLAGAVKRAARHGNQVIGVHATGIVLRAVTLTGLDVLLGLSTPPAGHDDELAQLVHHPPAY